MSSKDTPNTAKRPASREDRLKSALKANLQRRKRQETARGKKTSTGKEAG